MFHTKESSPTRSFSSSLRPGFQFGLKFGLPLGILGVICSAGYYSGSRLDTAAISNGSMQNGPMQTVLSSAIVPQPAVAAEIPTGTSVLSESNENQLAIAPQPTLSHGQELWQRKEIRGIYLSRFQVTGSASEQTIRDRVRYYKSQGINTIIHGVWGNGCPMYKSEVMQETFEMESCPNAFQDQWLDWLIDEAHKQDMQVHAYFEKGIKLDRQSPIFDHAQRNGWFVPGVDHTYAGVDHYILDVTKPEVNRFFSEISAEFVKRYPSIDAVQWDDYLGYHADLPGNVDRTAALTSFVQQMRSSVKEANPSVSFDLCHHNPYWSGRYFAADWRNWSPDRAFIQIYNDGNFAEEIPIAESYSGVAITEKQLYRLDELLRNDKIKSILIFPSTGNPEQAAGLLKNYVASR
jgi:uncharacterized lipoprotein YddW (UPF0748 family)